jgi:hypothetical protein
MGGKDIDALQDVNIERLVTNFHALQDRVEQLEGELNVMNTKYSESIKTLKQMMKSMGSSATRSMDAAMDGDDASRVPKEEAWESYR